MRGKDPPWPSMPLSHRARAEAMPHARWRCRERRSDGRAERTVHGWALYEASEGAAAGSAKTGEPDPPADPLGRPRTQQLGTRRMLPVGAISLAHRRSGCRGRVPAPQRDTMSTVHHRTSRRSRSRMSGFARATAARSAYAVGTGCSSNSRSPISRSREDAGGAGDRQRGRGRTGHRRTVVRWLRRVRSTRDAAAL